jgi:ligand-binding SRPBCC domain-containing protein
MHDPRANTTSAAAPEMPRVARHKLKVSTCIDAPLDVAFDLARSIDAHIASSAFTNERVVPPGRTSGLLELGDIVTFEGVHFFMRQRFTVKIVEMNRPHRYVDEVVKSAFRFMRHEHDFAPDGDATLMTDTIEWRSPFGILGAIADALFVKRHLLTFVTEKQKRLGARASRPL